MEERNIWLPAGLESPNAEPDDRASQRSEGRRPKPPAGAGASQPSGHSGAARPAASSGPWQPYDPDRPESKRSQAPQRGDAERKPRSDEKPRAEAEKPKPAERKPAEKEPKREKAEVAAAAKDDRGDDRDGDSGQRSDVDAMGQDKHRKVVGQRYGASRAKQLAYYGTFVAFVVAAYFGLKIAVDHLDKAPAHDPDQAPWSKPNAPDEPLGGFTPKTKGEKGPTNFQ